MNNFLWQVTSDIFVLKDVLLLLSLDHKFLETSAGQFIYVAL